MPRTINPDDIALLKQFAEYVIDLVLPETPPDKVRRHAERLVYEFAAGERDTEHLNGHDTVRQELQAENARLKRNAGDLFTAADRPQDIARALYLLLADSKAEQVARQLLGMLKKHKKLLQGQARPAVERAVLRGDADDGSP
jgi:hypothetical protein